MKFLHSFHLILPNSYIFEKNIEVKEVVKDKITSLGHKSQK